MMNENMISQIRAATCTLMTDGPGAATAAIQKALQGMPLHIGADTSHMPGSVRDLRLDFVTSLLAQLGLPSPEGNGQSPGKNSWRPISEISPAEKRESDAKSGGRFLTK